MLPTWCPFRLQIYFNGHGWLAAKLRQRGIDFTLVENGFCAIADWKEAQRLADELTVEVLHERLDKLARSCPVIQHFDAEYHWTFMQSEYATDIVFHHQSDLTDIPAQVVTDLQFDRRNVVAGSSYSVNVSSNLTSQTFFDVRFTSPRSNDSAVVLNWQRGLAASHDVSAGIPAGNWTVNGVRAHEIETDHTGSFVPVAASITVSP